MSPFKILKANLYPKWQLEALGDWLLGEEDQMELKASSGKTAGRALIEAVASSGEKAWLAWDYKDIRVVALFGYIRIEGVKGVVIWMVATPQIYKYSKPFLELSERIINYWCSKFGMLHGYIDTRNEKHIAWLKQLYFEFPEGNVAELNGVPFQYFVKEKTNV